MDNIVTNKLQRRVMSQCPSVDNNTQQPKKPLDMANQPNIDYIKTKQPSRALTGQNQPPEKKPKRNSKKKNYRQEIMPETNHNRASDYIIHK